MVRPWFSVEKEKDEGLPPVGFLQVVVAAVLGCFFGCFRTKDSRSHVMSAPKPMVSRSKHELLPLFRPDDDLLRNRGKARNSLLEEVDAMELKNEAKFLKACGTLPETPLEIRKASGNWVDTSADKEESPTFNSWLPTASIEKLIQDQQSDQSPPYVKYCEEWVPEAGCLGNTPSSCMTDGHNTRRNSISSTRSSDIRNVTTPTDIPPDNEIHSSAISSVSPVLFATSVRGKNKSVRFECQSDNSTSSSEAPSQRSKESGSSGNCSSESKPSPYPTPLKLTDEMQTPGTVFPAYSNNMDGRKTNMIRSQYVYSVLNPIENPIIWEDLKDENSDSDHSSECLEPNDEEPLVSVPISSTWKKDHAVGNDPEDEASFCWHKQHSDNQNGDNDQFDSISQENVRFGRTPGDRLILGTVNDEDPCRISPKWWDVNGIPNSTTKYKEDQKVSWHATPFEERLEKALSDGTFVCQRKPISGTPPVEFNGTEESDTNLSKGQSSTHLQSIASF